MPSEIQVVIELSNNAEAFNLFGSYDENLALLEDALNVKLVARGNVITVSGEEKQVEHAEKILYYPVSYTHLDVYKRQRYVCKVYI